MRLRNFGHIVKTVPQYPYQQFNIVSLTNIQTKCSVEICVTIIRNDVSSKLLFFKLLLIQKL